MKNQNLLTFAFLTALLFAGCASDADAPAAEARASYLQVNGTIDQVRSRVTDTDWEDNDQVGVSATSGTPANVLYTYTHSDGFVSAEGIRLSGDGASFTAYYPYASAGGNISFDVVDGSYAPVAARTVDFLFASAVSVTPAQPEARFQFAHKMSKLCFTVVDTKGNLTDATLTLTLKNIATSGTFDPSNGTVTPDAANGQIVLKPSLGQPATVLVPSYPSANTTAVSVVITVTQGENVTTYGGKLTPTLAAGTQYNYNLKISTEDPDLGIDGGVSGWHPEEGGDVDMEEEYVLSVGDYLLKDGTTKAPDDKEFDSFKEQIVGVVYYVGDNLSAQGFPTNKGLAIALKNAGVGRFGAGSQNYKTWAESNSDKTSGYTLDELNAGSAPDANTFLGYNNTQVMKIAKDEGLTNCDDMLALLETSNQSKADKCSDWYLPSFGELKKLAEQLTLINKSISKAEGQELQPISSGYDRTSTTSGFYWTSTIRSTAAAWISIMGGEANDADLYVTRNSNGTQGYFRFAVSF